MRRSRVCPSRTFVFLYAFVSCLPASLLRALDWTGLWAEEDWENQLPVVVQLDGGIVVVKNIEDLLFRERRRRFAVCCVQRRRGTGGRGRGRGRGGGGGGGSGQEKRELAEYFVDGVDAEIVVIARRRRRGRGRGQRERFFPELHEDFDHGNFPAENALEGLLLLLVFAVVVFQVNCGNLVAKRLAKHDAGDLTSA